VKILALVADGGASNEGHRHLAMEAPAHDPDARPKLCACAPCVKRREQAALAAGVNVSTSPDKR